MLAIIAPMATEIADIRRALGGPHEDEVTLRVTGVGKQPTESGIADAIASGPPVAIVMVGFCGAVSPQLRTGDLHVARTFYASGMPGPIEADPDLVARLESWAHAANSRLVGGASVTVNRIAGRHEKSAIHAAHGAMSVNMEDYWAARTAASHGTSFASVRAVLDTSDDELPDYLNDIGEGAWQALRGAARHPESVPALIRLASQARMARRSLTACVSGLLAAHSSAHADMAPLPP